jgi:hypothetical protein
MAFAQACRSWKEAGEQGTSGADLPNGRQKSYLGRASDSWRAEDARLRDLGENSAEPEAKGSENPELAKRWAIFLANHREAIAAMDFLIVPTLTFGVLCGFFVIAHGRRPILHFNVTRHPTSAWVSQQLRETFPKRSAEPFRQGLWMLVRLGSIPKLMIVSTTLKLKLKPQSKIK